MQTISARKSKEALAAYLLEIICCGEFQVSTLCQKEHLPVQDIEWALQRLQAYGYVERVGEIVYLKCSNTSAEFLRSQRLPRKCIGSTKPEFTLPSAVPQHEDVLVEADENGLNG